MMKICCRLPWKKERNNQVNNKKRIFTQLLFCCLIAMFLLVIGCSTKDDTATYAISGEVYKSIGSDALANVTIALSGSATSSTATNSDGIFSVSVANGTYTATPSLSGYTFEPVSTVVVINASNVADVNFAATSTYGADTYSISGTVTGAVNSDVKLTLSGDTSGTVMTGADGTYSFANVLGEGTTYRVTPYRSGYTFEPEYSEFTINSADAANIDFTSTAE
jgi:hypothetical protein